MWDIRFWEFEELKTHKDIWRYAECRIKTIAFWNFCANIEYVIKRKNHLGKKGGDAYAR